MILIDDEDGRPLTKAGHTADDVVGVEDFVVGVGQYWEGIGVLAGELGYTLRLVGGNGDDPGFTGVEPLDVLAQLRQVPPAEWSAKAPQEHDDDRSFLDQFGQPIAGASGIGKVEVRGR